MLKTETRSSCLKRIAGGFEAPKEFERLLFLTLLLLMFGMDPVLGPEEETAEALAADCELFFDADDCSTDGGFSGFEYPLYIGKYYLETQTVDFPKVLSFR